MNRIKILSVFILGVIAITATLGAVVYQSANAATDETDSRNGLSGLGSEETQTAKKDGARGHRVELRSGFSDEDLATALGISVEELQAAQDNAYTAGLTLAVEQGLITQAQADDLLEGGVAFPLGGRAQTWLENQGIDFEALLAEALGISVDELQAAKAQAFNANIDQAVTDGTITQEQADLLKGGYALRHDETFLSNMKSAYEAALAQAVEDGVITQAQADLLQEKASNFGTRMFDGMMERGNFAGGRGHGNRGVPPGQSSGTSGGTFGETTTDAQEPTTTP